MRLFARSRHSRICSAPHFKASQGLVVSDAFRVSRRSNGTLSHGSSNATPFRLAIIGSGPAGFYSAARVIEKMRNSVVDIYEKLPVPYGLVRFGVAPDHPEVKNCEERFEEVANSPRFNFIGNIAVGYDLPLSSLKPHYDAILFAYGASKDKTLGVKGEDLDGVYSARAFVGWYNGLPEYADLTPKLDGGEEAVVIGQGNVALDVARILLSDVDALRSTDITDYALETLAKSKIKRVRVVGRRGPMQAAFSIREVRELINLRDVAFEPIESTLFPSDISKLPRPQKRIAQLLSKASSAQANHTGKCWALNFLLSPSSFFASPDNPVFLSGVEFEKTAFVGEDRFDPAAKVKSTGEKFLLPSSIAFRSIGYKSEPLPGLRDLGVPFDEKMGIIPNDLYGRVITPSAGPGPMTAAHLPGLYCAGWVKRGPTGVIASTMEDAFISADIIIRDWENNAEFLNSASGESTGLGWESIKHEADSLGLRPVSWSDWKRIDQVEKERGRALGKEREKIKSVQEMLRILDQGAQQPG